jgi:hypothetical protein
MTMTSWTQSAGDRNPTFDRKEGASLKGIYTGKRVVNTKLGPANLYTIADKDDKKTDVWGTQILDSFFGSMTVGTEVEIKYLGKKKSAKGPSSFHAWELNYDKDTMPEKDITDEIDDIFKK